jgi:hypothetical protein
VSVGLGAGRLPERQIVLPEDGPVYEPKHVGVILNNNFNILCD